MMPANIYVSGSILLARTIFEYRDYKEESIIGSGIFLCIGKEWWVGENWGLGVAGFFEGAWMKDKKDAQGHQADITNQILGIAFTATMY